MAKDIKEKIMLESPIKEEKIEVDAIEVIEEIFNAPGIVKYKEKGIIKIIEVTRMNLLTLEKAIMSCFKLFMMFTPKSTLVKDAFGNEKEEIKYDFNFVSLSNFLNPHDLAILKEVVVSCLNITLDEFNKLPPTLIIKIINTWLIINKAEVFGFTKSFFPLKETLGSYATTLGEILPQNKK